MCLPIVWSDNSEDSDMLNQQCHVTFAKYATPIKFKMSHVAVLTSSS